MFSKLKLIIWSCGFVSLLFFCSCFLSSGGEDGSNSTSTTGSSTTGSSTTTNKTRCNEFCYRSSECLMAICDQKYSTDIYSTIIEEAAESCVNECEESTIESLYTNYPDLYKCLTQENCVNVLQLEKRNFGIHSMSFPCEDSPQDSISPFEFFDDLNKELLELLLQ